MNVLIVEDNKELAVDVYDFLCNAGYICKIANNCADAVEEFGSNDYDVMILDLELPDGDGFEVLHAIRKTKSKIAVIVLTARGDWMIG